MNARPTPSPSRLLVTGGGSGIGRATAELALAEGARVVSLDAAAEHWAADGLVHIRTDITDETAVESAFDAAVIALGGAPDAVVHCAGIYRTRAVTELTLSDWQQTMTINATGSFLVSRAAARRMTGGAITLLTSVAYGRGDEVEPSAHYSSSKGAVVSLTRQLSVELGGAGIRVNAVAPGVIDTPMTTIVEDAAATESLVSRLPARRLGTAEDVARACLFLSSDSASYITGVVLPVDGGYLVA